METLQVVLADMAVEKVTLAHEIKEQNPEVEGQVTNLVNGVPINYITHEELKALTKQAKAVIRTGEATPYANIILHAGVIF
jgi:D-ribose pyranase